MASESFFERVYEVVEQIPEGMVATYGQVALLAGRPRSARYVGYALHSNPGVTFADPMHVDLGACRWPAGL